MADKDIKEEVSSIRLSVETLEKNLKRLEASIAGDGTAQLSCDGRCKTLTDCEDYWGIASPQTSALDCDGDCSMLKSCDDYWGLVDPSNVDTAFEASSKLRRTPDGSGEDNSS